LKWHRYIIVEYEDDYPVQDEDFWIRFHFVWKSLEKEKLNDLKKKEMKFTDCFSLINVSIR